MSREWRRREYLISMDKARPDLHAVHGFLKGSYWAGGIPLEIVRRSVENSLVFGVCRGGEQAGVARVITDHATFAYLSDVFILKEHRGRRLGKWLMEVILSHPELQGLRKWMLATRDAHGLYRGYGFKQPTDPGIFMERKGASYSAWCRSAMSPLSPAHALPRTIREPSAIYR